MVALTIPESGGDPSRTGTRHGEKGLWQIHPPSWPQLDAGGDLYDPCYNAEAAGIVLERQGLDAWTTYRDGSYEQYLPEARAAVESIGVDPGQPGTGIEGPAPPAPWPADRHDGSPDRPVGAVKPGTAILADALRARFPASTSTGLYEPRKIAGTNRWSVHAAGRAIDLMFPGDCHAQGDEAWRTLTNPAVAHRLGIQYVIWCRQQWSSRSGERAYTGPGTAHTDHLHIEQHIPGSQDLDRSTARAVLSGDIAGGGAVGFPSVDIASILGRLCDGPTIDPISTAMCQAARAITSGPDLWRQIGAFIGLITSGELWLRILSVVGGTIAVLAGGAILVGQSDAGRAAAGAIPAGRALRTVR